MALRVTDEEVIEILDDLDEVITSLTPYITVANMLVTELCIDSGYSEERLKEIERWLSAHFTKVRDAQLSSESAGVSVSYLKTIGLNLDQTVYGQQAKLLDTVGSLAALNTQAANGRKGSVGMAWLGTEYD